METALEVPITKIDSDRRIYGGWAYVAKNRAGELVMDHSGDVVDTDEAWQALVDAFYDYALESRAGDDMHDTFNVSKLVELFVSDPARWESLGIPEGALPTGIFVAYRADNTPEGDRLWQKIRNGELKALSIVGTGRREVIDA